MPQPSKLAIDHQSLTELELFKDDKKGMSVFEMLDRTTTNGGRDNLLIHFLNPFSRYSDVLENQEVIKYMVSSIDSWKLPFSKELMDSVEMYFFAKVDVVLSENPLGQLVEGWFYRLTRKEYRGTAMNGTRATLRFLLAIHRFRHEMETSELPALLQQLFGKIDSILDNPDLRMACTVEDADSAGFLDLIAIDRWFRYKHKDRVSILIDIAYKLDVFQSLAKATLEYKLSFPELVDTDDPKFEVEGLYHLFLKRPIANDMVFPNGRNFLFLTGPNMAGKTTFLKSLAIAVYLAQLGMGVPAKRMCLSPFKALFSSLNTSDNLSIGYSYFYSEVMRVKRAAEILRKERKVLMIFDELFKGTNIKDAFDGSMLVINGLLGWKSGVFVLASHLTELSARISDSPAVIFKYFHSSVVDGKPQFSYKLLDGKSDERLGLIILQNEGIEELLNP